MDVADKAAEAPVVDRRRGGFFNRLFNGRRYRRELELESLKREARSHVYQLMERELRAQNQRIDALCKHLGVNIIRHYETNPYEVRKRPEALVGAATEQLEQTN